MFLLLPTCEIFLILPNSFENARPFDSGQPAPVRRALPTFPATIQSRKISESLSLPNCQIDGHPLGHQPSLPLQATDVVGPQLPVPIPGHHRKVPPRVRKPSTGHDVIFAPSDDLEGHRAGLREALGRTLSDQSQRREAILKSALAAMASYKTDGCGQHCKPKQRWTGRERQSRSL